jgi:UDP-glucose 4-epimerase
VSGKTIQIVAEMGSGDDYGIGAGKSHTILDVVSMFKKVPEMLPARRGNRMMAELCTDKTLALGWVPKVDLASYIESHISEVNK